MAAEEPFHSLYNPTIKGTIRGLRSFPLTYLYLIGPSVTSLPQWLLSCPPSIQINCSLTLKYLHWNGESMVIMCEKLYNLFQIHKDCRHLALNFDVLLETFR